MNPEISPYDCTADTLLHIKKVNSLLIDAASELLRRAKVHDDSKLQPEEKESFDKMTPILKNLTYGTDEYKQSLAELGPALQHHYENNSHHPEHYPDGIDGFDLFDLIECFMDWKAAAERTKDGDIKKSISINTSRFTMSYQLVSIFNNTADRYKF